MELKKPHPSRLVVGAQTWNGFVQHSRVVDKNSGGISWERGGQPHDRPPAQGSSARKISPHNFWLKKPAGIELWKKFLEPQAVPLKEPTHGLTYSDLLLLNSSIGVAA